MRPTRRPALAELLGGEDLGSVISLKGQLLREVILESKAHALVLGAGRQGPPGLLAGLVPDEQERTKVLRTAARECQVRGKASVHCFFFWLIGPRRSTFG